MKPKLRKDAAETAWAVVQAAVGDGPRPEPPGKREKNPEAVKRGRRGGLKGGTARAYGAVAASEGKSAGEIGQVVPIHQTSVSSTNPFLVESGLIERADVGNKATAAVVAYHRAFEWDPTKAPEKLAPAIRRTWYWEKLAPRLAFRPLEESEAVRVLAEEAGASKAYEGQIRTIIDFLAVTGLVVRDGTLIKKGLGAAGGSELDSEVGGGSRQADPEPRQPPPPPPATPAVASTVLPGIAFDVSIRITMDEISRLSAEQMKEFFAGMATVISAKGNAGA